MVTLWPLQLTGQQIPCIPGPMAEAFINQRIAATSGQLSATDLKGTIRLLPPFYLPAVICLPELKVMVCCYQPTEDQAGHRSVTD